MVAVQSPPALEAIDRLAQFALRAYDIEVDTDALDGLRSLNRRHALVFLPSHKSYLDPFILRGALGRAGLPVNHVLGGVNVSFWPMGPVLRRSGVVFIRRSIKDDAVYRFALRSYLGYLVERRYNLEWYLEGGRSRTGKLRPPRLGVLAYLVEAFGERGIDDVYLVPVSIAYDQLQEVAAMAAEEHGAQKKAETFAWMLKYIRAQGQRLGKAYVNVAEPLSLRQVRTGRTPAPDGILVGKIAFEVLHRINRVTPVTPTSLLTLALLGLGDRALTPTEIRSVLDPLLDYVAVRKLPQAGTVDLATPGGLRPALDALVTTKVVTRFAGGAEPVYAIGENQHLVAAYARNRIIHFFVTRAITELVLLHLVRGPGGHPGEPVGIETGTLGTRAWAEALRLRDLLKYEFFFAAKPEFAEELRAELAILDPDWERKAADIGGSCPPDQGDDPCPRAPPPSPPAWPSCRCCSATGSSARSSRPTWWWPTGWPPAPGPGGRERVPRRVHRRGPPVPPPATDPLHRVDLQGAVRQRPRPGRRARAAGRGRRSQRHRPAPAGLRRRAPGRGRPGGQPAAPGRLDPGAHHRRGRQGMTANGEELKLLLAEIEAGPDGPEIGAFFDFDGTLIAGYSAEAFVLDAIRRRKVDPQTMVRSLLAGLDMQLRGSDVTALMEIAAQAGKGRREEALVELGGRLFRERVAGTVYPEARAIVKAHQRKGHTVALASSATLFQAGPLAADLGIEPVLCTRIEVEDGRLTGRLDGPVLWGRHKADAVAAFASDSGVKLAESFGYANGDEDVEFLETVGRPRPLNPAPGLVRVAAERSWPVHRFEPGAGRASSRSFARRRPWGAWPRPSAWASASGSSIAAAGRPSTSSPPSAPKWPWAWPESAFASRGRSTSGRPVRRCSSSTTSRAST